jgi:exoribonuclease II
LLMELECKFLHVLEESMPAEAMPEQSIAPVETGTHADEQTENA